MSDSKGKGKLYAYQNISLEGFAGSIVYYPYEVELARLVRKPDWDLKFEDKLSQ